MKSRNAGIPCTNQKIMDHFAHHSILLSNFRTQWQKQAKPEVPHWLLASFSFGRKRKNPQPSSCQLLFCLFFAILTDFAWKFMSLPCLPHMSWTLLLIAFTSRGKCYTFYLAVDYWKLGQRYTYRVLQTIQMKLIVLCVWAEPAVLGSTKTALKFKYEI